MHVCSAISLRSFARTDYFLKMFGRTPYLIHEVISRPLAVDTMKSGTFLETPASEVVRKVTTLNLLTGLS